MRKLILIFSVIGLVAFTTGCSDKKEKRGARITGPNARSGVTTPNTGHTGGANSGGYSVPGSSGPASYGWDILGSSQIEHPQVYTSTDAILSLLSGQMNVDDPQTLGDFNSQGTGVVFAGQIKYDNNGNLIPNQSRIGLVIWDSIAVQNSSYAIRIYMGPERGVQASGQRAQNDFTARFTDEYGTIAIQPSLYNMNEVEILFNNNQTQVSSYPTNQWLRLGTARYSDVNGNLILY